LTTRDHKHRGNYWQGFKELFLHHQGSPKKERMEDNHIPVCTQTKDKTQRTATG
jgi:hypothetical protein